MTDDEIISRGSSLLALAGRINTEWTSQKRTDVVVIIIVVEGESGLF